METRWGPGQPLGVTKVFVNPSTGKTLTYLIPAIEHVIKNPPPGAGIGSATPNFSGELVLQITKDAETLCSYHALQIVPLIGGVRREKEGPERPEGWH
eukprot:Skav227481  [mRNA]  locus=scaffold2491:551352:552813:+ [translate_table: standard]